MNVLNELWLKFISNIFSSAKLKKAYIKNFCFDFVRLLEKRVEGNIFIFYYNKKIGRVE